MKCIAPLCLLFLLSFLAGAQSINKFGRTNTDTIPERFRLDRKHLTEQFYTSIPDKIRHKYKERAVYEFADKTAISIQDEFNSGKVYSDWMALETYINQILQAVMPPELKGDTTIHAYIIKNPSVNAAMASAGFMYVYLGLLDEVESEAELASVLAHELAHHYKQHNLESFTTEERLSYGIFSTWKFQEFNNDLPIIRETEADSLAMIWLSNSEYSLDGMELKFNSFNESERRSRRLIPLPYQMIRRYEQTHPLNLDRIEAVQTFKKRNGEKKTGKLFVVSQKKFYAFKEVIKTEILRLHLDAYNYDECIRIGFKYHLMNLRKPDYVYFIMEAIRRKCFFDKDAWKKNFVMDCYYEVTNKGINKKNPTSTHLFEESAADILGLTKTQEEMMEGKFYWDEAPRFKTYSDAMIYFSQLGEYMDEPECLLTHALSVHYLPEERNALLQKYLSYEKIQHRDFAENWLNGTLYSSLPSGTISLLLGFDVIMNQGDRRILLEMGTTSYGNSIMKKLSSGSNIPIDMDFLSRYRINDCHFFRKMNYLPILEREFSVVIPELYLYDPKYWEIMKKYNVNQIDIITAVVFQSVKNDNTIEGYKRVLGMNVTDVLALPDDSRYMHLSFNRFRMMKDKPALGALKETDLKLDRRKIGSDAIVDYFKDFSTKLDKIEK